MKMDHAMKCVICGALMAGVAHESVHGLHVFYVQASPPPRVWVRIEAQDHTEQDQRGWAGMRLTRVLEAGSTSTSVTIESPKR